MTNMTPEEILMTLVQGDDGRVWSSQRLGWSTTEQPPVPKCDWHGVICSYTEDNSGEIIGLDLHQTNYVGTIPAELGQLKSLKQLILKQNIIYGTIPFQVASLPHLVEFDVSNNNISGSIPKFLSKELTTLRLSDNTLDGTFPEDFGEGHPTLREVDAIRNRLSGGMPTSLGMLSSLNKLSLSENRMYGTIPFQLGYLPSLEYLYIDLNDFVGTVPRNLTPPNSPLKEVWFQGNQLSGTVPAAFAEMKNLVNLYVDGNKFTGQLPTDLCKPQINADFFEEEDNPDERDYCASIACPLGTVSEEGVWPCEPCPNDTFSPYLGKEEECLPRDEYTLLNLFYRATGGSQWTKPNNWFQPGVDKCDFTGITCNDERKVRAMRLRDYGLHGEIPQEVGFLEHLEMLDLADNALTGYLPSDLRFAPLDVLDVTGNHLEGVIPPTLCLAGGVNDNGRGGDYNCDRIACPVGTYNAKGMAGDDQPCIPCEDGQPFLGRITCGGSINVSSTAGGSDRNGMSKPGTALLTTIFVVGGLIMAVVGFLHYVRKRKLSNVTRSLEDYPDLDTSDYLDRERVEKSPPKFTFNKSRYVFSVQHADEDVVDDDDEEGPLTDGGVSDSRKKKKKKKKKGSKSSKSSSKYNEVEQQEDQEFV